MKKGIDYTGITVSFLCHDGKGKCLMHRRSQRCRDEHGRWDFGGGGLKFGELLEDGLKREIKEEYNADVINYKYIGHKELHREHEGAGTHWISFRFLVEVDPAQVKNNEPGKLEEVSWFTMEELPEPLHSMIPSEIENLKKELRKL